jgi:hypothetical protein
VSDHPAIEKSITSSRSARAEMAFFMTERLDGLDL